MAAKRATVDDLVWARAQEASTIRDEGAMEHGTPQETHLSGIQFDSGYLSPHFVTHPERMEVVFENVYILIHQEKISSKKDLLPLLDQIAKTGRPLLIIAEDIGGEALATLVVNKIRGSLRVAAVRAPSYGDQRKSVLQDIANLTGGKAVTESLGLQLQNIQISDLGQAKKITIDKNNTVVEGQVHV